MCNLFSGTRPIFFDWTKNGQKLSGPNIKIDNSMQYSLLNISNLSPNDSGTYECIAKNAFGTASTSIQFIIKGFFVSYYYFFLVSQQFFLGQKISSINLKMWRYCHHYFVVNFTLFFGLFFYSFSVFYSFVFEFQLVQSKCFHLN